MGYEVETEGLGSEWYEQGSASNAVLLEAFMTEGLFFEFVAGLELTTIIGCAINGIPAAKEIEIHGLHAVATHRKARTTRSSTTRARRNNPTRRR